MHQVGSITSKQDQLLFTTCAKSRSICLPLLTIGCTYLLHPFCQSCFCLRYLNVSAIVLYMSLQYALVAARHCNHHTGQYYSQQQTVSPYRSELLQITAVALSPIHPLPLFFTVILHVCDQPITVMLCDDRSWAHQYGPHPQYRQARNSSSSTGDC